MTEHDDRRDGFRTESRRNPDGIRADSKRPVPVPDQVPKERESLGRYDGEKERPRISPRYTAEDFRAVLAKVRYDLTAAQAKVTELALMLATVHLPTEDRPFSEERALEFVRRTACGYTDHSLGEELWSMGASDRFIDRALVFAAEVRKEREAA